MKISRLGKTGLKESFFIFLICFFCWVLLRDILPSYPKPLQEAYNLCDISNYLSWSSNSPLSFEKSISQKGESLLKITSLTKINRLTFKCKTEIPLKTLFSAKMLVIEVSTNKIINISTFVRRNGAGGMPTDSQEISPSLSEPFNLVIYNLDHKNKPKINWLVGDYNEVVFDISNLESSDDTFIYIKRVYLK